MELWRTLPMADTARRCDEHDIELLCELITRRIYPVNAFELLARIDLNAAFRVLLDLYVSSQVNPDRKFGGYYFELSIMLDDLKEIGGEQALRRLLALDRFDRRKLADHRVVDAFSEALEIEPEEFQTWLASSTEPTNRPS